MVEIIGRDELISALDALIGAAVDGQGAAVVLRGEAGIGKTVLLEHAVRAGRERGLRVLSVTGVQAEGEIPYAGLDQLLRPVRSVAAAVESPYRRAVEVLGLLGDSGEAVLLAVEDAHWLDAETWETLTFLGRRVGSDRIALVMAVRDGEDIDLRLAAAGLPELRLEPLPDADAGALLDRTAPGLVPPLRARVLDEAAGNPLGVVELGSAAARSGSSALLPSSLPLSTRVERTFAGLVAELPPLTRQLLLIAALNDGSNLDEIRAAGAVLTGAEVPTEAIQPAVTSRLVTVDEQYEVRFRHPLLRSALRQQAAPGDRRRVHEALAAVLADSPARRLWHRASAVPGRDEALARELTAVAADAMQRHTVAFALAAANRAVQLSEDPAARARRQIWAVHAAHEQGDPDTARRILAEIDDQDLRPADRVRVVFMRDHYFPGASSGPERLLSYAGMIRTMHEGGDHEAATQAMCDVALGVYYSNAPAHVRDQLVEATLALGLDEDDPRLTGILGQIAPVEHGAAAVERLRQLLLRTDIPPTWRADLTVAAWAVGAFDVAAALGLSSVADLRRQGRIGTLSVSLSAAAAAHASLGDTRSALPLAAESIALATEIGQRTWVLGGHLITAQAEALRGETDSARRRADAAEQALSAARRFPMLALVQRARGLAALAEGHAEDAFRQFMRVFDPADTMYFPNQQLHLLGHLAEAAVLGGLLEELRPVADAMEPVAERSQSPALRVGYGYARAVLTGDYEKALADDLTAWPFDRARLQLTYGSALRRAYKITESRPLLREAATTFDTLGATPWADRARAELRATGETRRRPMDALDALTPQEQQIARLAADGLSNREIGERLFLSPRTVSTHLYRIYPKVNVRSRAELARILVSSGAA
ncbi:LuxR C-terminal-related transcriptional regulator [Actinoplanes sp. TRM 88003]|uniref:LuxR C-terminal-related transcriptional regulator n=1 Tax=Paractinoplanes aksuensis TaxID=2939490 RepID=A0ABT1E0S4_9ACTN|nr:LuxR family transcriptional regulator [Actinoplanes aksuensis]MCO8276738.1 LuxR C-terminal-related transcriptional regulator [Actinoplanes aksuensis]